MKSSTDSRTGFTLVELLIVIVVIGILAALVTAVFNGVQARSLDASLQTDFAGAVKILDADKTVNGVYPASLSMSNDGAGYDFGDGKSVSYISFGSSYCLQVTHVASGKRLSQKNGQQKPTEEECQVNVSNVAGSGARGYVDGPAATALFNEPQGVVAGLDGSIYVADARNNRIRKISPEGQVSTFATGFTIPTALAIDASGTLYVGEGGGHRVRKITPTGVVSVLAGSGAAGFADGTGAAAQFNQPNGVAVDMAGNVFVADYLNHRIRKITPGGVVTTIAGSSQNGTTDGPGSTARFQHPAGIAVDQDGVLYIADTWNHRIRKISPAGIVSTLAGGSPWAAFADGTGAAARFGNPHAIAVDQAGTLYVSDSANHRIRKVTRDGVVTTLAGTGHAGFTDGAGTSARFSSPTGLTIDTNGGLYVADKGSDHIRKIIP